MAAGRNRLRSGDSCIGGQLTGGGWLIATANRQPMMRETAANPLPLALPLPSMGQWCTTARSLADMKPDFRIEVTLKIDVAAIVTAIAAAIFLLT